MSKLPARPKIASGPSRHVYDVIIVGGQLGGAVAGALLAKRGYRVLLVEHDGMGYGYEHDGYLLPYAPFVAPPLKAMPVFDEVLVELGLHTTVQRALKPHSPDLQLVLPDHRIDLHHDEQRRLAELTREFGPLSDQLNTALKSAAAQHEASDAFIRERPNLPPDGFFEALALKRQVARHKALETRSPIDGEDPPSRLLSRLLPFLTYCSAPEGLAQARPLSQALLAPNRYPGGREGLRELLCRKLTDLGGDLIWRETSDAAVVEELSFESGKLVGIRVIHSENVYRGACVIVATDAGALRRLVSDKKRQRDLVATLDQVRLKQYLFSVNWVLPAGVLPRGMGDLLLVETGEEDLGPLLVQVSAARKVGSSKEEPDRVVCAGCFVPASTRDLGEQHLRGLVERISAQLDRLMPFAKEHRHLASAPYLDASGVRGSRLLPHPLCEFDTERILGVTGLPQRTSVKNLFLASREVLPGLGLEGEILAGVRAAGQVQEIIKKADVLRR